MKWTKEDRKLYKILEEAGPITRDQAIRRWCGKLIARGANRDVYECIFDSRYVVKIQMSVNFDNIIEWHMWIAIQHATWWAQWFAPCLTINESGMVLIQKKVTFPPRKEYPKLIPRFFTDMKYRNYGFLDDRLVCVDYSNVLGMLTGFLDKKMRRAKWGGVYRHDKKVKNMRTKGYKIQAKL